MFKSTLHKGRSIALALGASAVVLAVAGGTAAAADDPDEPMPGGPVHSFNPDGYGPLQLGMDPSSALATDLLADYSDPGPGLCKSAELNDQYANVPGFPSQTYVLISPNYGVVAIAVNRASVHTPEGIRLGSTVDEVKAAYPASAEQFQEAVDNIGRGYIPVPNSSRPSVFRIGVDENTHVVDQLAIELTYQDCYE
ncbi:hypothetical protein [Goodfellowiella coeruleoviolacea]|uniref:Secreted protein n=1 Tax=Goodfellowiella coeruleoviolacea TaxID=334858 RepID=A0AAE3GK08_9PSEU|nr:hypothetical protein [Goodfellowiella coeruleoviolacea]MCP2168822.1 hypothetical protein [Goodfellowiella coeruleoviolacea]